MQRRLDQRPAQPRRPLAGDAPVVEMAGAALDSRHQAGIAGQPRAARKPLDVADSARMVSASTEPIPTSRSNATAIASSRARAWTAASAATASTWRISTMWASRRSVVVAAGGRAPRATTPTPADCTAGASAHRPPPGATTARGSSARPDSATAPIDVGCDSPRPACRWPSARRPERTLCANRPRYNSAHGLSSSHGPEHAVWNTCIISSATVGRRPFHLIREPEKGGRRRHDFNRGEPSVTISERQNVGCRDWRLRYPN
jgi:hypothetical protein